MSAVRPHDGDAPARAILVGVDFGGRGHFDASLDELALRIHERPELAYEERFASSALAEQLIGEGASVTRGAGGVETAFAAEFGAGAPVVADRRARRAPGRIGIASRTAWIHSADGASGTRSGSRK